MMNSFAVDIKYRELISYQKTKNINNVKKYQRM